jgi:hypothetical protein
MRVAGSSKDLLDFLDNLDEDKLVELMADFLAVNYHTNVKITDGPGDGSRDIYSLTPTGEQHITQCKFHKQLKKTISANELAELPMGLIRYGYQTGLFVTNARISPQAKRDYINSYPKLTLDFIEGKELAPLILGDTVLRALWYDGHVLNHVTHAIIIPFIARDLKKNRPIQLTTKTCSNAPAEEYRFNIDKLAVSVKLQSDSVPISEFEPYRPPSTKTISENWIPELHVTKAVITGPHLLQYIPECINNTITYLVHKILKGNNQSSNFAIRQGRLRLTSFGDESMGCNIVLPIRPSTRVICSSQQYDEREWLLPDCKRGWLPPERIQASQNNFVRWYNPQIDICLNLRLISPPSYYTEQTILMQKSCIEKAWSSSLFAVISKCQLSNLSVQPTYIAEWEEGKALCAWLVSEFSSGWFSANIEPDNEEDYISLETQLDEKITCQVYSQVKKFNGRMINPHSARHMFATIGMDPLPNTDLVEYRSVDILALPDVIPSPIDPKDRNISFDICWLVNSSPSDEDLTYIQNAIPAHSRKYNVSFSKETGLNDKSYLFATVIPESLPQYESTTAYLEKIQQVLGCALIEIEQQLFKAFPDARRATRYYWAEEIGLVYTE